MNKIEASFSVSSWRRKVLLFLSFYILYFILGYWVWFLIGITEIFNIFIVENILPSVYFFGLLPILSFIFVYKINNKFDPKINKIALFFINLIVVLINLFLFVLVGIYLFMKPGMFI